MGRMCCEANMFAKKINKPWKGWVWREQRGNRTEWNARHPKKICMCSFTTRRAVGYFCTLWGWWVSARCINGCCATKRCGKMEVRSCFYLFPQNNRCYCPTVLPRILFILLIMFFSRVDNVRNVYWDEIEPYPIYLLHSFLLAPHCAALTLSCVPTRCPESMKEMESSQDL